jgi:hypothetical protein
MLYTIAVGGTVLALLLAVLLARMSLASTSGSNWFGNED